MKKILNKLFHQFKEDSLSKKLEEAERSLDYRELKEIRNIFVVWNADLRQSDWLRQVAEHFPGAEIDRLCYVSEAAMELTPSDAVVLRADHLAFGGKITNDRLPQIMEKSHDLLIDLTLEQNPMLRYVLAGSRAVCKVGIRDEGFEHDIVIEGSDDPQVFIGELANMLSKTKRY